LTRNRWSRINYSVGLLLITAVALVTIAGPIEGFFPFAGPYPDGFVWLVRGFAAFGFAVVAGIFALLIRWPTPLGSIAFLFAGFSWIMFALTSSLIAGRSANLPFAMAGGVMLATGIIYLAGYFRLPRAEKK
jgi:hypothetical protein